MKLSGLFELLDPGEKAVNGDDGGQGEGMNRGGTQSEKERRGLKDKQLMVAIHPFTSCYIMLYHVISHHITLDYIMVYQNMIHHNLI